VRLFPGYAQQLDENEWLLSLRGWVCDTQIRSPRRRLTSRALQRSVWSAVHSACDSDSEADGSGSPMPIHPVRSDMQRHALLRRRVAMFLTKSHARVSVPVALTTVHGTQLWSSKTNSAGHFTVHAAVPQQQLLRRDISRQLPGGTWLTSVRTTPAPDGRVFEAAVLCIPRVGISVISDIDDTIKLTHVHNTRLMLRSTFLEEWTPVPGMPDVYREWASHGATFHYVSSSPWQLQQQLETLLVKAGFPPGRRRGARAVHVRTPRGSAALALT
jgi:phosphatidate phosphatase APP1